MNDKKAAVWLLIIIFIILVAQRYIGRAIPLDSDSSPWAVVFLLAAAALGLYLAYEPPAAEPGPAAPAEGDSLPAVPAASLAISGLPAVPATWRTTALGMAVVLMAFVLWRIPAMDRAANYWPVFLAWLAAILLFLAAVHRPAERPAPRDWIRARRWPLLAVAALALFAFVLRAWRIGDIPFTLAGDEASQGLEALKYSAGEWRSPFTTGWLGVPTMGFIFNSLSLAVTGPTIAGLRLPWALVGTLTVLTTFLLVRQLLNVRIALLTAFLVAVFHYHIHFSRLGSNQIADPLFMSLSLLFLYRGLDRRRPLEWGLAGVATGVALYFYAGARLTPVVIAVVLGYLFILAPRRFWADHRSGVAALVAGFLLTAAPMLQYAARFPDDFNARINEVGIIQSGWLERQVTNNGQSLVSVLFDQFQRSALMFNFYPDRTEWYGLPEPMLDPLFGAIFMMGLIYALLRLFSPQHGPRVAPMIAWWFGGMMLGGMLTQNPPSSQRLITLAVPTMFFIAYVLWDLTELARKAWPRLPRAAVLVPVAALFAFISLTTYFADYTPQRIYGGPNAELATTIAPRLNELKEDHALFMIAPPAMYWGFATLPYLTPGAAALDVTEPLTDPRAQGFAPSGRGLAFIVHPSRLAELDVLRAAFPAGVETTFSSEAGGRVLGMLFTVAAGDH